MMLSNNVSSLRNQLLAQGYKILPNLDKRCMVKGWPTPEFVARELTDRPKATAEQRIASWIGIYPRFQATGVRIQDGLVMLDIDVDDEPMSDAILAELATIAPEVAARAPTRFGGGTFKMALIARTDTSAAEAPRTALHSLKYRRPGDIEGHHHVEIFFSVPGSDKCAKQFGAYGPHSFNTDGTVKASYAWAEGMAALHETSPAELPLITYRQMLALIDGFKNLAEAAGWQQLSTDKSAANSVLIHDIDEHTRFEMQDGRELDYEGLCAAYAPGGELRCASSFHDGIGDNRSKCRVGEIRILGGVIGVWDNEECAWHAPERPDSEKIGQQLAIAFAAAGLEVPPLPAKVRPEDFYAFLPTHQYIYKHNGTLWPMVTINSVLNKVTIGTKPKKQTKKQSEDGEAVELIEVQIPASLWLDRHRPIMGRTWLPGEGGLIHDRLPAESGWIEREGVTTFNDYRPPLRRAGEAANAGRWVDLVGEIYPDYVDHIVGFCAHRIQRPFEKINHALVLAGSPGIGKDTLLEPLKHGVGPWNFKEISPRNIMERNNDFVCSVVLRVSELHDLGDVNRYALYEAMKTLAAAPPDMLRVNVKFIPEHYVQNVTAVIGTTNYQTDGVYLPADDRRHYVCGSELTRSDAWDAHCVAIWKWYAAGGLDDIVSYLAEYDLSAFDAKRPPLKTAAFWRMVDGGTASEVPELRDAIDLIGSGGKPPVAVTKDMVMAKAPALHDWLRDRKNARNFSRRMDDCGYLPVRNNDSDDGLWRVGGRRVAIYALRTLLATERYRAAEKLKVDEEKRLDGLRGNILPFNPV